MPDLRFENLPKADLESEKIDVPELLSDDDGDPYYVNVRGLTVHEWHIILRDAFEMTGQQSNGEMPEFKNDYDEICQVAAMVSYDDDGRLVFGADWVDAVERLKNLPRQCRPALARIHRKALALSGFGRNAEDTADKNKKKSSKTK